MIAKLLCLYIVTSFSRQIQIYLGFDHGDFFHASLYRLMYGYAIIVWILPVASDYHPDEGSDRA